MMGSATGNTLAIDLVSMSNKKNHIQAVLSATSHEKKSGPIDSAVAQEGDRIE